MTRRGLSLAILVPALLAGSRPALSHNRVSLTATCDGGAASIHGSITNVSGFDEDWVGWTIARTTVGTCTDWVAVSPVQAFPDSGLTSELQIVDSPGPDASFEYRLWVVDRDGGYIYPPASHFNPPIVYNPFVTCGSAPVTRASLWGEGWAFITWPCQEFCWGPVMHVESDVLPQEYHQYVGTEQLLDFYGTVYCGTVEGCFLVPTSARPVASCDAPVAVERLTWGLLRQKYD